MALRLSRHNHAMQEIELKFQVPAGQLAAVKTALLALPGAEPQALAMHAAYFDTPDNRLARHKMAVRVRREGMAWVQTFKAGGADAMTRLEDNQVLPPPGPRFQDGRPVADLQRHADPRLQAALAKALGDEARGAGLGVVYETVFDRHTALLQGPRGTVQLCLDQGVVRAGSLEEPLAEVEFELVEGEARTVIDLAREWVDRHGLWWDVQSKAYRGTRLAQAAAGERIMHCRPVALGAWPAPPGSAPSDQAPGDWALAVLNTALDTTAGNLSEVAWARPGWPLAAQAWLATLTRWQAWAADHPELLTGLPGGSMAASEHLRKALSDLPTEGAAAASQAQALAQGAQATHWGLDMLLAIATHRS